MGSGLRQLWGLETTGSRAVGSQQAEEFHQTFSQVMAEANQALQSTAVEASQTDHAALDAQRRRLYDAYQVALQRIDAADPARAERDISRVLAAAEAFRDRAAALAQQSGSLSAEWSRHESEFDEVVDEVGELEAAEHPKAPAMRNLVDAIRTRSNEHDYRNSLSVLSQVRPKVDEAYQQHQAAQSGGPGASGTQAAVGTRAASATQAARAEPDASTGAGGQSSQVTQSGASSRQSEARDATRGDTTPQQANEPLAEQASFMGSSVGEAARSPSQRPESPTVESAAAQPSRETQSPTRVEPHEATRVESQRPSAEQPSTPASRAEPTQAAEAAPRVHQAQHAPSASRAGDGQSHDAGHASRPLSAEEKDRMREELDRMEADLERLRSEHPVFQSLR